MQQAIRPVIAVVVSAALAMLAAIDTADAAKTKTKRNSGRNYGPYGFLPGVRSPEAIALERAQRGSPYGPYYYPGVGVATFYHGRWNGGSFGPCWTRTPIGMVWNCGR